MKRKLKTMSFEELKKLPTKRLLTRLKLLYQCEELFELSDRQNIYENPENLIEFKQTSEWKTEYEKLKNILADREHILRKI